MAANEIIQNRVDLAQRNNRGRSVQVTTSVSDSRPYLTRHLPNSYRRRIQKLAANYEVSLEEMMNCVLGHGLVVLEKIVREDGEG